MIKVEEVNEIPHGIGDHVFDPFGTSSTKKTRNSPWPLANLSDKNLKLYRGTGVKEQLKHVVKVTGTDKAFAAILTDGHVVTWGDPKCGGNSSSVQGELINVREKLGPKGLGSAF